VPRRKLPVRKINEILRLRAQGVSVADPFDEMVAPPPADVAARGGAVIATSTGAGRTTVYEYLARAESAGVGWPLPDGLDEETLEARLFPCK
jgi:hypothetical protein